MVWTTPLTAVANAVLTAAQWNASVRDDLNVTCPAVATTAGQHFAATGSNALAARLGAWAQVTTNETTGSTTFVDLTTSGPAVTVTTGPQALVGVKCGSSNGTIHDGTFMGYAVSGATTVAAAASRALNVTSMAAGDGMAISYVTLQTGLTAGSNTFTAKYAAGTAGTASFTNRELWVLPF